MPEYIYTEDLMFKKGLLSLLGTDFISEYFIIIDFDNIEIKKRNIFLNTKKEVVGFASNDFSYYKAELLTVIMVIDKKSKIKDIIDFFLFKKGGCLYKPKSKLTVGEKRFLFHLNCGMGMEEISVILNIKKNTAYSFRRNIILKLGCRNRIKLINFLPMK